ncbi:putative glycoside hydrolase [Leptospira sp. GIMC2001]|uniref:putative glycoside hydrolase n=1 Tax=Leptospira sp. GIMC2001 TaxID=1513297 RepID=UPI0023496672|nr:putative glycoside hydrolase [Leptospira sp. GIMC2001]WCL50323.1 glycosyl hydrolase [Leptospira sp. GIMC2001]
MIKIVFFTTVCFFIGCQSQAKATGDISGSNGRPDFYQGVYISNRTAQSAKAFGKLIDTIANDGMNAVVIDAQPRKLDKYVLEKLQEKNVYGIARVVAFEGGLTSQFPKKERMDSIKKSVRDACTLGFKEINIDYIRYSDGGWDFKASFEKRYENITSIIQEIRSDTLDACSSDVLFGGDIFGRVPFIENDAIGQRVENFSEKLDLLYPMLYPSHFYGLKSRVGDPYTTVLEGMQKTIKRSKETTLVVGWIQGFRMHIGASGLSYTDYIKAQMQGCLDSKGKGFIVWNAMNEYEPTLEAFRQFKMENSP